MTILESERLQIRGFRPGDWRDLREYVTLPEVTKYDYDYPSSEEDLKGGVEYFIETPGYWAVCLRASGKLIGHVTCIRKEPEALRTWDLGCIFNPAYHGQGYATEACRRVLDGAYAAHPERFVRGRPVTPTPPQEIWINPPVTDQPETPDALGPAASGREPG